MDTNTAIDAFSALAQPTRLEAFRMLAANEPKGLPAGEVARALKVPHNTMSTHLALLMRAGLVTSKRQGRSVIYCASIDGLRSLILFLLQDCCGGRSELCAPLIADLQPCCSSKEKKRA